MSRMGMSLFLGSDAVNPTKCFKIAYQNRYRALVRLRPRLEPVCSVPKLDEYMSPSQPRMA